MNKNILRKSFTAASVVLLTGFVAIARNNVALQSANIRDRFDIAVFLEYNVTAPEVVSEKIRAIDNVFSVKYVSKEDARIRVQELRSEITIAEGNPFPDSFLIIPASISMAEITYLSGEIKKIKGIEDVQFDRAMVETIEGLDYAGVFATSVLTGALVLSVVVFLLKFPGVKESFALTSGFLPVGTIAVLASGVLSLLLLEIIRAYLAGVNLVGFSIPGMLAVFLAGVFLSL
ncbi:MAG: permease-like cell division protein FtsX [Elusimicrobiota bacterium]